MNKDCVTNTCSQFLANCGDNLAYAVHVNGTGSSHLSADSQPKSVGLV